MFTLRRVEKISHEEENVILGKEYKFTRREWHPKKFKELYNACFQDLTAQQDDIPSGAYGIIHTKEGAYLLEQHSWNYIMTENGATFANVSYVKPVGLDVNETTADAPLKPGDSHGVQ